MELRWWASPALADRPPPGPFPLVAYDPPCAIRELAFRVLDGAGIEPALTGESPHLSGVQAAVRNGLGYALLAGGGDGLRPVAFAPLAAAVPARLWLVPAAGERAPAAPLRAALWRATTRRSLPVAA